MRSGGAWLGIEEFLAEKQTLAAFFENVLALAKKSPDGKSNLNYCLEGMARVGYNAVALELSPDEFGFPQSRKRLHMIASKLLTPDDFTKVVRVVDRFKTDNVMALESFILPEGDAMIQKVFEEEMVKKRKKGRPTDTAGGAVQKQQKWPDLHSTLTANKERQHDTEWKDPLQSAQCPWFDALSDRERDLLTKSDPNTHIRDLSQNMDRGSPQLPPQSVPIVLPRSRLWLKGQRRLILSCEKMALQGIVLERELLQKYDEEFLSDLAGNAFAVPTMFILTISFLLVLAEKVLARNDAGASSAGYDDMTDLLQEGEESMAAACSMARSSCSSLGELCVEVD